MSSFLLYLAALASGRPRQPMDSVVALAGSNQQP